MTANRSSPDQVRFDLGFYIGPCTEAEAQALADTILDLAEFKAVHGGGVSMNKVDDNYKPIPWKSNV